jgi:transcriptional regulator with XRE-family HTH domain
MNPQNRTADTTSIRFAEALRNERTRRNISQDKLGALVNLTGARIGQIEAGTHSPMPDLVFRLEEALGLPPGRLSQLLGYVPTDAVPDVITALNDDPFLDDNGREAVRRVYEVVVQQPKKPTPS